MGGTIVMLSRSTPLPKIKSTPHQSTHNPTHISLNRHARVRRAPVHVRPERAHPPGGVCAGGASSHGQFCVCMGGCLFCWRGLGVNGLERALFREASSLRPHPNSNDNPPFPTNQPTNQTGGEPRAAPGGGEGPGRGGAGGTQGARVVQTPGAIPLNICWSMLFVSMFVWGGITRCFVLFCRRLGRFFGGRATDSSSTHPHPHPHQHQDGRLRQKLFRVDRHVLVGVTGMTADALALVRLLFWGLGLVGCMCVFMMVCCLSLHVYIHTCARCYVCMWCVFIYA